MTALAMPFPGAAAPRPDALAGGVQDAPAGALQDDSPEARAAWRAAALVPDPEIPVVGLAELGILRAVRRRAGRLQVVITPTYSGCPAMSQIEDDLARALAAASLDADVTVELAPAWTTDWITAGAREKLRAFGIAPPAGQAAHEASDSTASHPAVLRFAPRRPALAIACPHCGSRNTTETSHFGSTACKSLHKCLDCLEPFDHFKPY